MAPHSLLDSHSDNGVDDSPYRPVDQPVTQVPNGATAKRTSHLRKPSSDEVHDLLCVGFGPASLAVAVALNDAIEAGKVTGSNGERSPKVVFLEKQQKFAWHAGMLLPGAKMQISFMKDMATFRDPTSKFTFINYLHQNDRLVEFTNLSTFTPARAEFEDYLRWCSSHFDDVVNYGSEVLSVAPVAASADESVSTFTVTSRSIKSGAITTYRAKNVIVAIGGQAALPKSLPANHPRVIHSSQYAHLVPKILSDRDAPYRVAVLGGGQSAAEIFTNIQNLYPNSKTSMVMRAEFLKPSDDSPFVNSIFNPSYVDDLYTRPAGHRHQTLADARATNYSVVRLELIEELFERMYDQQRELGRDETQWPHRIRSATEIMSCKEKSASQLQLHLRPIGSTSPSAEEFLDVDLIISATGYQRSAHLSMLDDIEPLLPASVDDSAAPAVNGFSAKYNSKIGNRDLKVSRDYKVQFAGGKVAPGSGLYLQGTNEGTHGLSDTLLSILAVRSGEVVNSIFGTQRSK